MANLNNDEKKKPFVLSLFLLILIPVIIISIFIFFVNPKSRASLKPLKPFCLIYTNNLQGTALNLGIRPPSTHYPVHYFSETREIINRLKKSEDKPVLLIDAGNSLTGYDDFSRMFDGKPMVDLLKMAGFEMAPADESFDFSKIPPEDKILYPVIKNIDGQKIAVYYDFCFPDNPIMINPEHELREKSLKKLQEALRKNPADFNILVYRRSDIKEAAEKVQNIDLIIPGNYNDALKEKEITVMGKTPAAPFVDSRFALGKVDILSRDEMTCRAVPTGGADPRTPEDILNVLAPYIEKFKKVYPENYAAVMSSAVGYGEESMTHSDGAPWESSTGDFIADLMRGITGADIAIINHQAVRENLQGIISIQKIQDALAFNNEIITMDLTGREIRDILESNAHEGGTFYRVSGIMLGINPEAGEKTGDKPSAEASPAGKTKGEPVIILYRGKPLDPGKTYRVAAIDYLVNSDKEKYAIFREGKNKKFTGLILNNILMDQLSNDPLIKAPHERIIIDDAVDYEMLKKAEFDHLAVPDKSFGEEMATGCSYYGKKNYEKALGCFQKSPSGNFFSALCFIRMGKIREAGEVFRKMAQDEPENPRVQKLAALFPENDKTAEGTPKGEIYWRTFKGDFRRTGRSQFAGAKTGNLRWKFQTHHSIQSSPVIGHGGIIYCASGDGFLYAVSPEGVKKWDVNLGKVLLATPTIAPDGTVYIGSDNGMFYSVSSRGKILWKFETKGWVKSSAALGKDGTIYVGSDDKHLYALSPGGKLKWKLKLGHEVFSSPTIDENGKIIIGCLDRNVYCVSPAGEILWKYALNGKIYSTPAVADDGTIYIGSDDAHLYALTPEGKLRWKFKSGGFIPSSPAVAKDGTIYIGSEDCHVYALTPEGKVKWKFKTGYEIFGSPVIDKNGNIFIGSDDTFLYALTPEGKLIWKYRAVKYIESSPAIAPDGTVYFASDEGFLYAVGK